jgi:hypothetical protein
MLEKLSKSAVRGSEIPRGPQPPSKLTKETVNKHQWGNLFRDRPMASALAVKIKPFETQGNENQQDTTRQKIKLPLHFLLTQPGSRRDGHCR